MGDLGATGGRTGKILTTTPFYRQELPRPCAVERRALPGRVPGHRQPMGR